MTYGVGSTGFTYPSLDTIVTSMGASLQAALGSGINLVAPSVFSQIVGILAEREFLLWQTASAVYASQYPSTASDQALDNVCTLTGITRLQPTYSTVGLTVNLNAGVTLPAGKIASAGANTAQWETLAPAVNAGGSPANVVVAARCVTSGPIPALAGTLTTIVTPYSGWNTVTNVSGAVLGRSLETDPQLRARRLTALFAQGTGSVDALRSALIELSGVLAANVFQNATDVTDSDGVPPHAVECVVDVSTATADEIRDCIWANVAAGIRAYGTTTGTVVDSQGVTQQVDFTYAAPIPIYVTIELTKTVDYGGDPLVKQNVADYINALVLGEDVVDTQLYTPIFAALGVTDVTKLWVSDSDPPAGPGNVTIGSREKPTCATANISVVST